MKWNINARRKLTLFALATGPPPPSRPLIFSMMSFLSMFLFPLCVLSILSHMSLSSLSSFLLPSLLSLPLSPFIPLTPLRFFIRLSHHRMYFSSSLINLTSVLKVEHWIYFWMQGVDSLIGTMFVLYYLSNCIYSFKNEHICLFISLSVCLIYISVYSYTNLHIYISIYLSIDSLIYQFLYPFISLLIHLCMN